MEEERKAPETETIVEEAAAPEAVAETAPETAAETAQETVEAAAAQEAGTAEDAAA